MQLKHGLEQRLAKFRLARGVRNLLGDHFPAGLSIGKAEHSALGDCASNRNDQAGIVLDHGLLRDEHVAEETLQSDLPGKVGAFRRSAR